MANTFTNINDVKVMSEGVAALNHGLTPLRVFTIDAGSNPAVKNGTVYVPLATARTATTHAGSYVSGDTTIAGQTITVSDHIKASWYVDEEQAAQTTSDPFGMGAVECAYAIASYVFDACVDAITIANYGSTEDTDEETVTAANFDADAFATVRNICIKTNKWRELSPGMWGSAVLDGAYITNLIQDPAFRDLSASGDANVLRSGMMGRKYGFDVYENNRIVDTTPGSTQNLVGFFCQPACIAAAVRPIQPLDDGQYIVNDIAVDPDTGVAASYRRWQDPNTGYMWGTFTVLMGVGAVDTNRLVAIRSA